MTDGNKASRPMLHFVTLVDERRDMVSFCCEGKPLSTARSFGPPSRCPFCQQRNPVSTGLSVKKDREKI
jgi:hypothetical protein